MHTQTAIDQFYKAKPDLTKGALDQYHRTLNALAFKVSILPGSPEDIRDILKDVGTIWMRVYYWNAYHAFYKWVHLEYELPNIMEKVERPRKPEIEIQALPEMDLAKILAETISNLERTIISLALDCGIRASEFGRIKISDIHPEYVWVTGKRSKRARVPISPDAQYLLQQWIDNLQDQDPNRILFVDKRSLPLSRYQIYDIVRRCIERAGIKGTKRGPHILRHSLGMNYIVNGGDPFSLKRIMRHNNIATTNKYVNLAMDSVIASHNKFSPLRNALQGVQRPLS